MEDSHSPAPVCLDPGLLPRESPANLPGPVRLQGALFQHHHVPECPDVDTAMRSALPNVLPVPVKYLTLALDSSGSSFWGPSFWESVPVAEEEAQKSPQT